MLPSEIRVSVPDVSTSNVRTYGFSCWCFSGLERHFVSCLFCEKEELSMSESWDQPLSVLTLTSFSLLLCTNVGYVCYQLDVWDMRHIHVDSKCMCVCFLLLKSCWKASYPGGHLLDFCGVGLTGSLHWQWWRILTSGLAGGPSALFHIKSLQHWGGIFPFDILVSIMASCSFAGQ